MTATLIGGLTTIPAPVARLLTANEDHHCFNARMRVFEAAMGLSRAGLSPDTIREAMKDMAEHAAERAIAWGREQDRLAAIDMEDVGDELEDRREAAVAEQESER